MADYYVEFNCRPQKNPVCFLSELKMKGKKALRSSRDFSFLLFFFFFFLNRDQRAGILGKQSNINQRSARPHKSAAAGR